MMIVSSLHLASFYNSHFVPIYNMLVWSSPLSHCTFSILCVPQFSHRCQKSSRQRKTYETDLCKVVDGIMSHKSRWNKTQDLSKRKGEIFTSKTKRIGMTNYTTGEMARRAGTRHPTTPSHTSTGAGNRQSHIAGTQHATWIGTTKSI